MEDLVQVGSVGLVKAIEKYDPERGNNFVAFAVPSIVGEIKNYFRDHGWAVKVPRKFQRQKLEAQRSVDRLTQLPSRSPTIPEIAEATGFSEEEVYDTIDVRNYGRPLSLDALFGANGREDGPGLLENLASEDPQFEGLADRVDLSNALRCLDDRERTIIHLKFYANLSQTKIAHCLGISQMHVSRLQRIALRKLRLTLEG